MPEQEVLSERDVGACSVWAKMRDEVRVELVGIGGVVAATVAWVFARLGVGTVVISAAAILYLLQRAVSGVARRPADPCRPRFGGSDERRRLSGLLRPGRMGSGMWVLTAAATLSAFGSLYRHNTVQFLVVVAGLNLLYFLSRITCARAAYRKVFYCAFGLLSVAFCGANIAGAVQWSAWLQSLGFDEFSSFRARMPSITAGPIGETATVMLALLPFCLVMTYTARGFVWWWVPCAAVSMAGVLHTLSRGAYLGSAVLLAGVCLWAWRRRADPPDRMDKTGVLSHCLRAVGGVGAVCAVAVVIVSGTGFARDVLRTCEMGGGTAQARSTQGRLALWERVARNLKSHPVLGVGAANFSLANVSLSGQHDEQPYVGRAFNAALQLAMEQGLVGLGAALWFVVAFFWTSLRAMRMGTLEASFAAGVFLASFCALLVRDCTYSSLLMSPGVAGIVVFMAAHNSAVAAEAGGIEGFRDQGIG